MSNSHFSKAAILLDSPAHLEFFMKINADKSLNDAISELTPVVRKQEVYVSKSKSAQPNPFNEKFIDHMVSGGLVNLYRWFVQVSSGIQKLQRKINFF